MKPNFTIRIYGIYVKDGKVLLSKEKYGDVEMTKFPGGGLEYGEGTIDCLKREMMEEFNVEISVLAHFYTTDFFVESAFHQHTQVMSIYYSIDILSPIIPIHEVFVHDKGHQLLFWKELSGLNPDELTFPIDKKVVELLQSAKI